MGEKMPRGIQTTEKELAMLIRLSSYQRPVQVGWGNGLLLNTPENAWAFWALGMMRSAA